MRILPAGTVVAAIFAVSAVGYAQSGESSGATIPPRGEAQVQAQQAQTPAEALRTKAQVRVIVQLVDPAKSRKGLSESAERKAIAALQSAVLADVFGIAGPGRKSGGDSHGLRRYSSISAFAINVDKAELERLEADPRVVSVALDREAEAQLNQSTKLIQMNAAWSAPYVARGAKQTVAIIDTGVNLGHKFLKSSRIIGQACFSGGGNAADSFCPNGKTTQKGGNSGRNCPMSYNQNCLHGTHVAGIASGFNTSNKAGQPKQGVAFKSNIVAVQVFKKAGGNINSSFSDMLAALDWLFKQRNAFPTPLASVNMSIGGGGPFSSKCDSDTSFGGPQFKQIIGKLRNAGIATTISSGNDGFLDGVSAPACVSNAVAVGASTKMAPGQPERIASYSNIGKLVDVLAPGGDLNNGGYPSGTNFTPGILSSVPGNKFASLQGTSMAAPHVAGVFAAIRSAKGCGNKPVNAIEAALKKTGKKIKDVNHTKPRVNVKNALDNLGCGKKASVQVSLTAD